MRALLLYLTKPRPAVVGAIFLLSAASIGWWAYDAGRNALSLRDEGLYEARVLEIVAERQVPQGPGGRIGTEQDLLVEIIDGGEAHRMRALNDLIRVPKGTDVIVQGMLTSDPEDRLYVVDVVRRNGLVLLGVLFAALLLAVAGIYGAYALTGLIFSFAVIFNGIVPAIARGYDPVISGLLGSFAILIVTLYVSHGFNRKSLSALIGIVLALIVVGVSAQIAVGKLFFTGFSAEEAIYLTMEAGDLNLVGLLVAGIIIAAIGVLDDIAITQAAAVFSLASVDSSLRGMRLFRKAMEVGRDHISAVVNTLVLAYTGAALPLILLLTMRQFPLGFVANGEIVAEEIVRTLLSSAGLVLAVPLTTLVAAYFAGKQESAIPKEELFTPPHQ